MGGMWPMGDGGGKTETIGDVAATSRGTVITSSGTANTKGAYTEFVASSEFDASGILIVTTRGIAGSLYLLDLAIGAASSEQVIVENVMYDFGTSAIEGQSLYIPIGIPQGSRIALRIQASTISATSEVVVTLFSRGFGNYPSYGRSTTYGTDVSDSGGSQVQPGGTANTKGNFRVIAASTTNDIKAFSIMIGKNANVNLANANWLMDFAVGGSGSEVVVLPDLSFCSSATIDKHMPKIFGPFNVNIPAATRITVRAQCTTTNAVDRVFDAAIYAYD